MIRQWWRARAPRPGDDRGSSLGALMFAVVIAAVITTAALASMHVSQSRSAAEHSGMALLSLGDRVQLALDEVNSTRTGPATGRITTGRQCDGADVCTDLREPELTRTGEISLVVTATTPDGARATRQAVLRQLPTSGVITGVDATGRLEFVEDGGTGTDLWQIISGGTN